MANQLIISKALPIKFVKLNPVQIPQYVTKWMDEWQFQLTILDFQEPKVFIQRWGVDDSIRIQVISNYGPLTLALYNCSGNFIYSSLFETRQQDQFRPGYYIRQVELDLATFDTGQYYLQIETPGFDPYISELFEITEDITNTLYLEYSHPDLHEGIYFNSPFLPTCRIPGILPYEKPGSHRTTYEDQNANETLLKSVSYEIDTLTVGDAHGIPPYMIDKIDRMLGCPSLKFDGRLYTRPTQSEWDKNTLDLYPMAGWSIELRPKMNRSTLTYEDDVVITGTVVAAAVIDSKGFGLDPGGNYIEVYDVN